MKTDYSIEFAYPGPTGNCPGEETESGSTRPGAHDAACWAASDAVEAVLRGLGLDWQHEYAWPDGSLIKTVHTDRNPDEVRDEIQNALEGTKIRIRTMQERTPRLVNKWYGVDAGDETTLIDAGAGLAVPETPIPLLKVVESLRAQVKAANEVADAALEALRAAQNAAFEERSMLGNLLARIHGDGGQYQAEHGTKKAVEDAEMLVVDYHARLAFIEAEYAQANTSGLTSDAMALAVAGLKLDLTTVEEEKRKLHLALRQVLGALGNGSGATEAVSIDFLCRVPDEVRAEVSFLRNRTSKLEYRVAQLEWGNEMACENTPNAQCECSGCSTARARAEQGEVGP